MCRSSKRIPRINVTKEIKYLYSENYKTLMKETEDNKSKWKDKPCSWIGELKVLKCQHYPKQSTVLMQSLSKYP